MKGDRVLTRVFCEIDRGGIYYESLRNSRFLEQLFS